eukprot:1582874-Pleurochrysis_carterae.AAC.2
MEGTKRGWGCLPLAPPHRPQRRSRLLRRGRVAAVASCVPSSACPPPSSTAARTGCPVAPRALVLLSGPGPGCKARRTSAAPPAPPPRVLAAYRRKARAVGHPPALDRRGRPVPPRCRCAPCPLEQRVGDRLVHCRRVRRRRPCHRRTALVLTVGDRVMSARAVRALCPPQAPHVLLHVARKRECGVFARRGVQRALRAREAVRSRLLQRVPHTRVAPQRRARREARPVSHARRVPTVRWVLHQHPRAPAGARRAH